MSNDDTQTEGPITAAVMDTALASAYKFFESYRLEVEKEMPDVKGGKFRDPDLVLRMLQQMWQDPDTNGDASVEAIWTWIESSDPDKHPIVILLIADAILSYATQAMKAEERGDFAMGWKYVGEARYWEGILNGMRMRKLLSPGEFSATPESDKENPASIMALRRHAASAAEKKRILEYWKENIDPGLSAAKAATQIVASGKFSLEYRTIQTLISASKKTTLLT